MNTKLTPAQMRRKIERLEAKVKFLDERVKQAMDMYLENFHKSFDYSERIHHALRILKGEED